MAHKNPTGYWEHQGSYLVFLTDDAGMDYLPVGARLVGGAEKTVRVEHGRIKQVMGGIQFYAGEQPFAWGYKFIKKICDGMGNVIWQNYDYRETEGAELGNLDDLQKQTEKLLSLLNDRQPGLMTWNQFMLERLESLQQLISQALGK